MKRFRYLVIATFALVASLGTARAHDDESQGIRQMWRDAKSEVKQFFGMRSASRGSGCPMMGGGQPMSRGGMMGGGMMGDGATGGAPNDQWRERSAPPPTAPREQSARPRDSR